MNKISGFRQFELASGKPLELKFCNGSTEIFAELMGLNSLDDIDAALTVKEKPEVDSLNQPVLDENGVPKMVPDITASYLKAIRLFVYAAAKYAAQVQGKPVDFNEWTAAEWIEELGRAVITSAVDMPEESEKKSKKRPQPAAK